MHVAQRVHLHTPRNVFICTCRVTRALLHVAQRVHLHTPRNAFMCHAAQRVHFCMSRNAFICACRATRSFARAAKRVRLQSLSKSLPFSSVGTRGRTQSLRGKYPGRLQSVAGARCGGAVGMRVRWGARSENGAVRPRCGGAVGMRGRWGARAENGAAVRWACGGDGELGPRTVRCGGPERLFRPPGHPGNHRDGSAALRSRSGAPRPWPATRRHRDA